jgi:hypothetical protein
MHNTYELICRLAPQAASDRIGALLSHEGVRFKASNLFIASTNTPIAVLGVQSKLYTRKNWVGINPFAFISSVDVNCEPADGNTTKVTISVNRRRALLFFAFWVACGYLVARAMPQPSGVILLASISAVAWLGVVSFLGGYLVKKEIDNELRA